MIEKSMLLILLLGLGCSATSKEKKEDLNEHVLWYAQPASKWMEALPIGNGRLGAMIFGDTVNERIQLNEDSFWAGGPDWGDSKGPEDEGHKTVQLSNPAQNQIAMLGEIIQFGG